MAEVSKIRPVGGSGTFDIEDEVARTGLATVTANEEYDRQAVGGVYAGREIASIPELASAISSAGGIYPFLHARASSANFAGLRVGDYVNVNCGAYGTVRFDIAHFDPYFAMGDNVSQGHHICFVAHTPIAIPSSDSMVTNNSYLMWNTTNTNQGTSAENSPYMVSQLHDWETTHLLPAMPAALTNNMLNRRALLETRYSASGNLDASTGWAWKSIGKVWSLSEIEVYGCVVWGTPGWSVGESRQLDIFRRIHSQLHGQRANWWLRTPSGSSASDVCYVHGSGDAGSSGATNTWRRPRPGFLLG